MKKILALITVFMFTLSSLGYAGGDKNCGTKGLGSTGTVDNGNGKGLKTQKRLPLN